MVSVRTTRFFGVALTRAAMAPTTVVNPEFSARYSSTGSYFYLEEAC